MAYTLGVDLGTTYTAAAVFRDGRAEVASLGTRTLEIPSVVLLRDDGVLLIGEPAERRSLTEPGRFAREFKRRMGDPTPILLGGTPFSAHALMAHLLRGVVKIIVDREGERPAHTVVTCPANWGDYKRELLDQVIEQADIGPASIATEPEAAAVHYASTTRVAPGDVVAVYDLGGGTFDAAVLRNTGTGFELVGDPRGIEQLGGVYFDEAVFAYVVEHVSEAFSRLDPEDAATVAAVSRLRRECVEAKETLSWDTDTTIPVALPSQRTEIRLTRSEFENRIRPALVDTVDAMRRALLSADVRPDQLTSVLLVGGSSRIPLVGQMLVAELGRPVAIDVHPKHAVALGAAHLSGAEGLPLGPADGAATVTTLVPPTMRRTGPATVTRPGTEPAPGDAPPIATWGAAAGVAGGALAGASLAAAAPAPPDAPPGGAPGAPPGAPGAPPGRPGGPPPPPGAPPTAPPGGPGAPTAPPGAPTAPPARPGAPPTAPPGVPGVPGAPTAPPARPGAPGGSPGAPGAPPARPGAPGGSPTVPPAAAGAPPTVAPGGPGAPNGGPRGHAAAPVGAPPGPGAPTTTERGGERAGRRPLPIVAIAGAVVLAVAVVGVLATRGGGGGGRSTTSSAPASTTTSPTVAAGEVKPVVVPQGPPLDVGTIAYTRLEGPFWNVWLIGADGSSPRPLTREQAAFPRLPVLSPDRRSVAYSMETDAGWQLRVIDTQGAGDRLVFDHLVPDARATWSPDGTRMAFVSDKDGPADIYVLELETGKLTNLTHSPEAEGDPAWSPDGKSIAYWSRRGGNQDIYVIPATGGAPRRLTVEPGDDADPAWQPLGSAIAYSSQQDGDWEIYAMDPDGHNQRQLTDNDTDDQDPSWSSDGQQIAFESKRDNPTRGDFADLYVMAASGADQHNITNRPGLDVHPAWGTPPPVAKDG